MGLPPIYAPETVMFPGMILEEKTYPQSFLAHLLVTEPNKDSVQRLLVSYRPYNYSTGDIYPDRTKDKTLLVEDLELEAKRVPLLGQAMYYVVLSASLLLQEKTLIEQINALPDGPDKEAKQAELTQIRTNLGITQ